MLTGQKREESNRKLIYSRSLQPWVHYAVKSIARNIQAKKRGLLNYAVAGDVVGTKENMQICICDNMWIVSELHAV